MGNSKYSILQRHMYTELLHEELAFPQVFLSLF